MVKIIVRKGFKTGIQGEEKRFTFAGKESKLLGLYIG